MNNDKFICKKCSSDENYSNLSDGLSELKPPSGSVDVEAIVCSKCGKTYGYIPQQNEDLPIK